MDLAAAAIAAAHLQLVSARESYLVADFLQLPPQHQGQYDWVVEHTCLCALDVDCRPAYADAVYQALKPGGHVLAIFYREVSDYNGEGPPHPISAAEIEDLFGTRFERVEAYVPQHTYPSRPVGSEEVVCLRRRG
jgi:SAM-dependent methyltransferase